MIPGARPGDLIVTWPKTRPLKSYLAELELADRQGLAINYRVAQRPMIPALGTGAPPRCYMVHDGLVRGYNEIAQVTYRHAGEVQAVGGDGPWPAGWYIVRRPRWFPLDRPVAMAGFRGFRYAVPS